MGLKSWWDRHRQRSIANRQIGKASRGGEGGSFEPNRQAIYERYQHKQGSGAFVFGRVPNWGPTSGFLSTTEERHCIIIGSTRSEKLVSLMAYNVLTHPGRSVCFDPKAEMYFLARQALEKKGIRVVLWDPFKLAARKLGLPSAPHEAGFNPVLDMLGEFGVYDPELPNRIQELVTAAINLGKAKSGGDGGMQFWNIKTSEFVEGLIAYGLYHTDEKAEADYAEAEQKDEAGEEGGLTYGHLWEMIKTKNILFASEFRNLPREDQTALVEDMVNLREKIKDDAEEKGVEPIYPSVIDLIVNAGNLGVRLLEDESGQDPFGSLLEMIGASFKWINGPVLKEHLRAYDTEERQFSPSMLKSGEENVALFVVIPDTAMESHAPYLRMVLASLVDACTINDWGEIKGDDGLVKQVNPKRYKINFFCDEVPLWGHMPALERAFRLGAGADIRMVIVTQTASALMKIYGKEVWDDFIGNSYQILLCGGDTTTGEEFSKKAGHTRARKHKTGEREDNTMVRMYQPDQIWHMVHESRRIGLLFANGEPAVPFYKCRYYKEDESGLKKFIDYTPLPQHVTKEDMRMKRDIPRDLLPQSKGVPSPNGRQHMQFGSASAAKQLTQAGV